MRIALRVGLAASLDEMTSCPTLGARRARRLSLWGAKNRALQAVQVAAQAPSDWAKTYVANPFCGSAFSTELQNMAKAWADERGRVDAYNAWSDYQAWKEKSDALTAYNTKKTAWDTY